MRIVSLFAIANSLANNFFILKIKITIAIDVKQVISAFEIIKGERSDGSRFGLFFFVSIHGRIFNRKSISNFCLYAESVRFKDLLHGLSDDRRWWMKLFFCSKPRTFPSAMYASIYFIHVEYFMSYCRAEGGLTVAVVLRQFYLIKTCISNLEIFIFHQPWAIPFSHT